MDLSIEIRRMAVDAFDSIGQVDPTESVKALYLPRLSSDGMGLMLERAD